MKKILAIIGVIVGLAMIFTSTLLFDLETTYVATSIALLLLGLIITFISGSYLGFELVMF